LCSEGEYDRARGEILQENAAVSSDGDTVKVGHSRTVAASAADTAADEALKQRRDAAITS